MTDEGLARPALLTLVRRRADAEGPVDQFQVQSVRVPLQAGPEGVHAIGRRDGRHSIPSLAKLTHRSPARITWSYTGTSSRRPHSTSCRATAPPSALGLGSPLGGLSTT